MEFCHEVPVWMSLTLIYFLVALLARQALINEQGIQTNFSSSENKIILRSQLLWQYNYLFLPFILQCYMTKIN